LLKSTDIQHEIAKDKKGLIPLTLLNNK